MSKSPENWRDLARKNAGIIKLLERRIDTLEAELRESRALEAVAPDGTK